MFDAIEAIWDSKGGVGPGGGDKCARVFSVRHSGVLCVTQASQADTYQSGPLQGFPTDSLASMSQVEAILFPFSPLPLWATSAGRPGQPLWKSWDNLWRFLGNSGCGRSHLPHHSYLLPPRPPNLMMDGTRHASSSRSDLPASALPVGLHHDVHSPGTVAPGCSLFGKYPFDIPTWREASANRALAGAGAW